MKLNELIATANGTSSSPALKDLAITALTRGYNEGFAEGVIVGIDKAGEVINKRFNERNPDLAEPFQGIINDFSGKVNL